MIPYFFDPSNNFYQLQPNSPLIDLGMMPVNPMANEALDFNMRVIGNSIDLGAYEFWENPVRKPKKIVLNIEVYPNPVSSTLNIKLPSISTKTLIEIYSIEGRNLFSHFYYQTNKISLDVSTLRKGIYLLVINEDHHISQQKIIKE